MFRMKFPVIFAALFLAVATVPALVCENPAM